MLSLIAGFALLGAVASADATADPAATLEALRARIDMLQSELKTRKRALGRAERALDAENRALERQADRLAEIEARMRERLDRVRALERERAALLATMDATKAALAELLRAAHRQGERDWLRVLLDEDDPGRAGRLFAYQQYAARARAERIDAMLAAVARADVLSAEVQAETARLAADEASARAQLAAIEARRAARARRVAELSANLDQGNTELRRLRANARELAALLAELARVEQTERVPRTDGASTPSVPFKDLRGKLPWPVDGRITRAFGAALGGGYSAEGVTLATAAGTEVIAVGAGRVVFADQFGQLGLLVIVDHGDGYMSLYGQTTAARRGAGDWIAGGEVIATVGPTTDSESGVYFEIRANGRPVDPGIWCRPR